MSVTNTLSPKLERQSRLGIAIQTLVGGRYQAGSRLLISARVGEVGYGVALEQRRNGSSLPGRGLRQVTLDV